MFCRIKQYIFDAPHRYGQDLALMMLIHTSHIPILRK